MLEGGGAAASLMDIDMDIDINELEENGARGRRRRCSTMILKHCCNRRTDG
jgi:hypothetical protein